jgi:hypothetical protein
MFRRLVMVLCAILATGVFVSAEARKNNRGEQLVVLAEVDVDLGIDKFSIDVSAAKGAYKGIRVRNVNAPLMDVQLVQVVYDDGTVHNEARQIDMYRGERSRPINPTWEHRFVDRINVEMIPQRRGRGRFQVLGIQDEEGRRMDRSYAAAPSRPSRPVISQPSRPSTAIDTRPTTNQPTDVSPGSVTAGGDVLLGSQYVGFGVDRDTIRVGGEIGKFDRIRFRVLDNDIFIREIRVVYANGETDSLAVNAEIPKNSRTNWIPIKGTQFIREIQMIYRSKTNFRGQARIEVFGDYARGWLGPQGEGRRYNLGWVLLGAQTAGFVGFDRDVIPVGRNEGGFKRVRVTVRDRAITLNEVKVIYVNGEETTVPVRARVDAGSSYGPIELAGESRRAIERVEAKYRSRFFDSSAAGRGSAVVEIWGQH